MPIEIKELHIRVALNPPQPGPASSAATGAASSGKTGSNSNDDKDAIVAECVEQVLEILQRKLER